METELSQTPTTITVATGTGTATNRSYRIKVSQIECSNLSRPPAGCTQYFTGTTGTVESFNFGNTMQGGLFYTTCVRQEAGYCSIGWSASTNPDGFQVTSGIATSETTQCEAAYLNFPTGGGTTASSLVCGSIFNALDGQTSDGSIFQTTAPFQFVTRSITGTAIGTGYKLNYAQQGC